MLSAAREKQLCEIVHSVRRDVAKMDASEHVSTNLSVCELLCALYFFALKHNPRNVTSDTRDRLFISDPTLLAATYATIAHTGAFAKTDLFLPSKEETINRKLAHANPLGQPLGVALGSALALQRDHKNNHVFALINESEHASGTLFESLLFARAHNLRNLTIIINRNNTHDHQTPLEPLRAKYESFGFHVTEVDGHNLPHLANTLARAKHQTKPSAIIAHTTLPQQKPHPYHPTMTLAEAEQKLSHP